MRAAKRTGRARLIPTAAAAAIALPAFCPPDQAAAQGERATPVRIVAGSAERLTLSRLDRRCGRVTVTAFVPRVSPYGAQRLRGRFVGRRRLSVVWRPSREIRDELRWWVVGSQRCRGRTRSVVVAVVVTPRPRTGEKEFLAPRQRTDVARPYQMSDAGAAALREDEDFAERLYNDPGGGRNCTIGYGHLVHLGPCDGRANEREFSDGIDEERARELFRADTATAAAAVTNYIWVPLSQDQVDALINFTYNVGSGALAKSSLRDELHRGQYDQVGSELGRWVKSGGRTLRGLVRRRAREAGLFGTAAPSPTLAGLWDLDEGVVEFRAIARGTFTNDWVRPRPDALCPEVNDQPGDMSLTGDDRTYAGTWRWVQQQFGACSSAGDGSLRIELSEDGTSGELSSDGPGGGHEEHTLTRLP